LFSLLVLFLNCYLFLFSVSNRQGFIWVVANPHKKV